MSVSKLILPQPKSADQIKAEMLDKIGDLSGVHVYHNWVLGMIYVRENFGSIIRSDNGKEEDKWQGKVCCVVKAGPSAFQPSEQWQWNPPISIGDWIVSRASDGVNRVVNGQMCRLFRDTTVTEKIAHPDSIF